MREIDINEFSTGINFNQRTQYTWEWGRWNLIPIFPIETPNFLFVFLLISANTITSKLFLLFCCYIFIVLLLYLANIVLDNSLFIVGSISVLRNNYYFWQMQCTCRKMSSACWFIFVQTIFVAQASFF